MIFFYDDICFVFAAIVLISALFNGQVFRLVVGCCKTYEIGICDDDYRDDLLVPVNSFGSVRCKSFICPI